MSVSWWLLIWCREVEGNAFAQCGVVNADGTGRGGENYAKSMVAVQGKQAV